MVYIRRVRQVNNMPSLLYFSGLLFGFTFVLLVFVVRDTSAFNLLSNGKNSVLRVAITENAVRRRSKSYKISDKYWDRSYGEIITGHHRVHSIDVQLSVRKSYSIGKNYWNADKKHNVQAVDLSPPYKHSNLRHASLSGELVLEAGVHASVVNSGASSVEALPRRSYGISKKYWVDMKKGTPAAVSAVSISSFTSRSSSPPPPHGSSNRRSYGIGKKYWVDMKKGAPAAVSAVSISSFTSRSSSPSPPRESWNRRSYGIGKKYWVDMKKEAPAVVAAAFSAASISSFTSRSSSPPPPRESWNRRSYGIGKMYWTTSSVETQGRTSSVGEAVESFSKTINTTPNAVDRNDLLDISTVLSRTYEASKNFWFNDKNLMGSASSKASKHAVKLIDRIKKQTVPGPKLFKGLVTQPDVTRKASSCAPDLAYPLTKFSETPFMKGLSKFAKSNWLVLGEVVVIVIAKIWPKLGCTGGPLKPEFFISKLGVFLIFFLNGMAISMKKDESDKTNTIGKTNMLIQAFNIVFIPLVTKLLAPLYPNPSFRDGFLVLSVIPTTINICVAQTLAAGGNMPMVIFNAILSNLLGVILTPILSILILGASSSKTGMSLWGTFSKLGSLVVLPMVLGQIVRLTPLVSLADRFYHPSRTLSSLLLLAIVYTTFSDTFLSGLGVGGLDLLGLLVTMPLAYVGFSGLFWVIMRKIVPGLDARGRAAALLSSSQKTLAFGIPFIKTALGHRPDLVNLLAPLLLYAPAQLIIGSSIFVPRLAEDIKKENEFETGGGI